ncbi:hypothetical protein JB92DRAFT_2853692 [Gautieria morchelliformis]|nr:hypothetical protein JB92DRAFT_2853692 [Gautieria morchelliformis]
MGTSKARQPLSLRCLNCGLKTHRKTLNLPHRLGLSYKCLHKIHSHSHTHTSLQATRSFPMIMMLTRVAAFGRLLKLVLDTLSRMGIRSILEAWRFLTRISSYMPSAFPRESKISPRRSYSFAPLDDSGHHPVTVVHCESRLPSSLSGPTLPYALIDVDPSPPTTICYSEREEEGTGASHASLKKTTPSTSLRYRRTRIVSTHQLSFNPQETLNPKTLEVFCEWTSYVHPEGQIYYYHARKRVVTEANLKSPSVLDRINFWLKEFDLLLEKSCLELPTAYELALELDIEEEGCSYYLVDHDSQTTFYLDGTDTTCLDLPDVCSMDHLKLLLEEQYWIHLEYFPMHKSLPPFAQSSIIGILTHAWGDQSTSSLSTAPYSAEKCKEFINMIEKLTGGPEQEGYRTCIVSRLMNEFTHSRFINLYGQADGARLARNQSTTSEPDPTISRLNRVFFAILLFQPHTELKELKSLWVDRIVYTEHWRTFIATRMQEWRSVSLLSAILLLVDTTLIIHYHQQPANGGWLTRLSGAGTGCLTGTISLMLSMSTVIVSVTAIIVHQPLCTSHASDADGYLQNASHDTLGLQPLAIVLSLPRTLFMWSMATAGVALLMSSIQLLNTWGGVIVGALAVLLSALLLWMVRFFCIREPGPGRFSAPFAFPAIPKFFRHKNEEQDKLSADSFP